MTSSVAERAEAAKKLVAAARVGRALMGGTEAMRREGEAFLPKFPAESAEAYAARKNSSFLFNGYKKTVKDMAGRIFGKSIEVAEGTLDEDIEANIDGQGNDLSTFAKAVFTDALSGSGLSFIMADAPRRDGELTKAQAASENLRPFLVHIKPEEVLGWKTETVGSKVMLTMFRVHEIIEQDDPDDEFATECIEQIRVLTMEAGNVRVRLYRSSDERAQWYVYDDYLSDATEITVIPFYAAKTGFFMAEPPLQDLADKNIEHWQSASDQRNILHAARVPILFATGRDDDEGPLVVSTGVAVTSRNTDAVLEWVEHSGEAIGAGRQDLEDIKFEMQILGLQLLVAGSETATGASLDAAKETAPLAMMADGLKDALEQALAWISMYQGSEQKFTVTVNKDFGVAAMTAQEVTAMLGLVNQGLMSKAGVLRELARRGFIAEDTDIDAELDLAEENDDDLMDAGATGGVS